MKTNLAWQWSAFGKHPVASDFFRLGEDTPLLRGFSDWVEKGYHALASIKAPLHTLHAWRFWARGPQKESIACGVVRDSSDRVGRPYPLLIMGMGLLNGWEDHWDLLPFACERTWGQIEYLSSFITQDLKKFEQEVQHLRPPLPGWPDFEMKRKDLGSMEQQVSVRSDQTAFIFDLKMNADHDQLTQVNLYHVLIRNQMKSVPNVVFMGGTLERTCLVLFRRPLQTADFVQLWSVSKRIGSIHES